MAEWDTIPGIGRFLLPLFAKNNGRKSRWEEITKTGLCGLRLLCPNGQAGELEAARDHALFQLKIGTFQVGRGTECEAHLIGVIDDDRGACTCFAWEMRERRLVGPFRDNAFAMRYRNVGYLAIENLGLKV